MNDKEQEPGSLMHFGVSVACDPSGFFRRECPQCDLVFKEAADDAELLDPLTPPITRLIPSEEHGPRERARITCPYCGHKNDSQAFLAHDMLAILKRTALREVFEPKFFDMLRDFGKGLPTSSPISVKISAHHSRSQRPLPGLEPDDQVAVRCLGCSSRFKVYENWRGTLFCPTCGIELQPY
jgi:hypothetical protein